MPTIFAEGTPPGRGGVSIIRISGPEAWQTVCALAGTLPPPRRAAVRLLREGGETLDQAMILTFAEGESFTGEQMAELHLHGAPVVVQRVSDALRRQGLRRADAGEFMRRAFLAGRVDLVQAEGFSDLLAAETEAQRRQAMRAADGAVSEVIAGWRAGLIRAAALIAVSIDFADEEVPQDVPGEVFDIIRNLRLSMQRELEGFGASERIREGFEVALIGAPNAGKSSLLNALARRDVALVSPVAGTTRDIIEVRMDIRGLAVTFLDTAGLREAQDEIEAQGIARALARSKAADLTVALDAGGTVPPADIVVRSKIDQRGGKGISAHTGEGLADLLETIFTHLSAKVTGAGIVSHRRQRDAIADAVVALADVAPAPELAAEQVRLAVQRLDEVIGKVDVEEYLDIVFSSFCIGK